MDITPEIVVNYLSNLVIQNKLIDRAKEYCDEWFRNEGGEIDGWTSQELQKQFHSHSLTFNRAGMDLIYIDTRLTLLVLDHHYRVGDYRLITTLDGNIDDDYLILDCPKTEFQRRIQTR